ncbi:MAG: SCP-like extracellular [Sphingobium sp.]|nr:SCP-like extracellular [Sphingobium sp.]
MRNGTRAWRLLPFGMALLAPLLLGTTGTVQGFHDRILAAQNRERASLDIAPLNWDADLAADAQSWADHLARTGEFRHAEGYIRQGAGENLWAGTRGAYAAEEMVGAWMREKRHFTPGPFPTDENDIAAVGHYTQIVWRKSHAVGCALARGRTLDVLVCRYRNAGNVQGERPY